ncbi:augmenter of liver regeneration [Moniliophthora roreri MCA 2997]|uniref:Sulfhydryl oxidase n=2 Tax=Moniliophthora roreri TaxID=221103 RepID=V2XZC6_MONRO|nr:augmenter of liver regeneration [Moniliophthora roreri MCA 2997]KAI3602562.1 augmenter of liver regeneration [Moniliophthora roreri]
MSSDKPQAEKKSPGIILGPDGKPCRPCTAFRHWTKQQTGTRDSNDANTVALFSSLATGNATPTARTSTQKQEITRPPAYCPPDVEELGRATWTFLHSTAAYYPTKPTPTQRANMISLIRALPLFYPCHVCADDFGEDLKRNPPDVSGREGLSRWLCERHNEVNRKLGKEVFDCSLGKLDERWKDGPADGSCD